MLGTLNQRASIFARTIVADGGGGAGDGWTQIGAAWVSLAPLSGADVFGPDAAESLVRHRVTMRRYGFVQVGQRVVIGPRTLRVLALLDPGPPSQTIDLLCEELP